MALLQSLYKIFSAHTNSLPKVEEESVEAVIFVCLEYIIVNDSDEFGRFQTVHHTSHWYVALEENFINIVHLHFFFFFANQKMISELVGNFKMFILKFHYKLWQISVFEKKKKEAQYLLT